MQPEKPRAQSSECQSCLCFMFADCVVAVPISFDWKVQRTDLRPGDHENTRQEVTHVVAALVSIFKLIRCSSTPSSSSYSSSLCQQHHQTLSTLHLRQLILAISSSSFLSQLLPAPANHLNSSWSRHHHTITIHRSSLHKVNIIISLSTLLGFLFSVMIKIPSTRKISIKTIQHQRDLTH